jgi:hypothetical protein
MANVALPAVRVPRAARAAELVELLFGPEGLHFLEARYVEQWSTMDAILTRIRGAIEGRAAGKTMPRMSRDLRGEGEPMLGRSRDLRGMDAMMRGKVPGAGRAWVKACAEGPGSWASMDVSMSKGSGDLGLLGLNHVGVGSGTSVCMVSPMSREVPGPRRARFNHAA